MTSANKEEWYFHDKIVHRSYYLNEKVEKLLRVRALENDMRPSDFVTYCIMRELDNPSISQ